MSRYTVDVTQNFSKPVEEVFARLSDHNQLSRVLGIPVKRIQAGRSDLNGPGSVRRMGLGPLAVEETVVAVTTNQSIDYRISKGGAPLKNHSGRISFTSTPTGSSVNWQIHYEVSLPLIGAVVRQVLTQGLSLGLKRLR